MRATYAYEHVIRVIYVLVIYVLLLIVKTTRLAHIRHTWGAFLPVSICVVITWSDANKRYKSFICI